MSALRGRVHKRDYTLPGGDRYVAWVAEVHTTASPPPSWTCRHRDFWDNWREAYDDVTDHMRREQGWA